MCISFIFAVQNFIFSQDLEQVKNQKPFAISGSIGGNYTGIFSSDTLSNQVPNFWNINGQLNMSVYGIMIPLNIVVANGNVSLDNVFNQFGMSPKYKWLKVHAGHRRMNFSNYTLSDQTFLGLGAEVNYKLLRFGGMWGRFSKARSMDSTLSMNQIPGSYPVNTNYQNGNNYYARQGSFNRTGYAIKLGIGTEKNNFDLIYFKAKDNLNSVKDTFTRARILPEENVGIGASTFQTFAKHFSIGATAAVSIYTYNTEADQLEFGGNSSLRKLAGFINGIIPIRATTQLQWAGEANAGINYERFSINAQYRYIQPYYRSMGIVSYLSDLRSLSVSPSWSLFKHKLRFTNNFMFQSDNLNKYKFYTTSRNTYSSTVSYNPTNKFGIDVNYLGYTFNQIRSNPTTSDSLKTGQNSHGFTVIPHYFLMKTKANHIFTLMASYTLIKGTGLLYGDSNTVNNYFTTFSYSPVILKSNLGFTVGINYNYAQTFINKLTSIGIILGVNKSFFGNKLTVANSNSYLLNNLDGKAIGSTYTIDLSLAYNPTVHHSILIGGNYVQSPANGIYTVRNFNQLRFNVGYRYIFGKLN